MYPVDIEFFDENGNSQTYTAAALSRSTIETNIDTKVDQCEVSIDNVTREMSAYIANTEFVGRRMKIIKVFLDADRNVQNLAIVGRAAWSQLVESVEGAGLEYPENAIPIFDGIMDAPRINQYQMTVTVVSKLDTLDRKLPARTFQVQCPWQFGDAETCGATVPEKAGIIDSLSTDHLTIYDANIIEEVGYWEHGEIAVGNEIRIITESGDGYVKVEYPFSADVEAGNSYIMKAGCDKSYDGGHGCTYWGNTQYYGGFLSIPKIRNIREVS
jgi:phage-related protein